MSSFGFLSLMRGWSDLELNFKRLSFLRFLEMVIHPLRMMPVKIELSQKITWFFVVATFLSYMVPQAYAFLVSDQFIYVNGWDEETYLSYQMAMGVRNTPGYFCLYLSTFLHNIGFSGAVQNLLFDFFLIPLTFLFVYKTFRVSGIGKEDSGFSSLLILFSSVLCNYANPWVKSVYGLPHKNTLVMPGWEFYPSILRSPEPQISYFLVSLTIYLFFKFKKQIVLLFPLPVLYYFVFIPYLFFVLLFLLKNYLNPAKSLFINIIVVFVSYVSVSFFVYSVFMFLSDGLVPVRLSNLFIETNTPLIPLAGLLAVLFYVPCFWISCFKKRTYAIKKLNIDCLVLLLSLFLVPNIHVLTGFSLSVKNYFDYSIPPVFGLFLSLIFILYGNYSEKRKKYAQNIALAIVFILVAKSQGFSFERMQYNVYIGKQVHDKELLSQIIRDPLHAIVPSLDYSSKINYFSARSLSPVLSYQYRYSSVEKQCNLNAKLVSQAIRYINNKPIVERNRFQEVLNEGYIILENIEKNRTIEYKNQKYCNESLYGKEFYDVNVSGPGFRVLPDWGFSE